MNDKLVTTPEPRPDYSSYIAGWKRRQQLEKAAIENRRDHARQIAAQATEILKQHGANKVILFGSILDHTFKLDSDIDLAVEMPAAAWWKWYLRLGETLDFPIDLVHLGKINEGFREIIFQFGEVIYRNPDRRSGYYHVRNEATPRQFIRICVEEQCNDAREIVKRVEKELAQIAQTTPDDFVVAGFAGYACSFYNGLEKIFGLVAEYVDNFKPPDKAWHKELLKQMALEIQGVRPAVLTAELASVLEGYLEFRHFFRHSYSFDLDWNALKPKVEQLKPTFEKLEIAFQQFFAFLQAASEHIE